MTNPDCLTEILHVVGIVIHAVIVLKKYHLSELTYTEKSAHYG